MEKQIETVQSLKKKEKIVKLIVIGVIVVALIIAAIIIIPKLINSKTTSTRIVNYTVSDVSYGNITETISGSGNITPVRKEYVSSTEDGVVDSINFIQGNVVSQDQILCVINGVDILAPYDCVILEKNIKVGDVVTRGSNIFMIMSKEGFTISIAVSESQISLVALKQEVTFTFDALGTTEYTGSVTNISYNGSSSGSSVAFQITAKVDFVKGLYPGMSADAKIVIEDSGEGLLVPVDAVYTSGDLSYVYLCPTDDEVGTVYDEEDIDLDSLVKVYVETGMSDGTNYIVTVDDEEDLVKGDKILIRKVTSTLTESDSSSNSRGSQGFGGGNFNFGDFDFGDFDPSQIPGGGGGGAGAGFFPGGNFGN